MSGMIEKVAEVVLAVENQDKVVALFEDLFGLELTPVGQCRLMVCLLNAPL